MAKMNMHFNRYIHTVKWFESRFWRSAKIKQQIKLLLGGMLHLALLVTLFSFSFNELKFLACTEVEKFIWKFAIILIGLVTLI